VNWFEIIPQK